MLHMSNHIDQLHLKIFNYKPKKGEENKTKNNLFQGYRKRYEHCMRAVL